MCSKSVRFTPTMFTSHVKLRGAEPSKDVEPALKQVSATHHQVIAVVFCADFSPFGPHGKRPLRKLTFLNWTFMPDGS